MCFTELKENGQKSRPIVIWNGLPCKFERMLQHVSIVDLNPYLYEIFVRLCVFSYINILYCIELSSTFIHGVSTSQMY